MNDSGVPLDNEQTPASADLTETKSILEAALLVAGEPVPVAQM